MEANGICVCGHKKEEHEPVSNPEFAGKLVCMHPDNAAIPESVSCDCLEYREAETVAAGA